MKSLRVSCLLLLLLLAQATVLLHTIEHLQADSDEYAEFACSTCIALHTVDSPPLVAGWVTRSVDRRFVGRTASIALLVERTRKFQRGARAPPQV
ncbi:MAG: hypothetical protein E6Q43_00800 [Dokdonella sp.]|nr:MAG: hypothetical protein E6Q43_00800 [Dokdonella sp.]